MLLGSTATLLLGTLTFWWGVRVGRLLLRRGATANDLFKGRTSVSLAFLGLYVGLMVLALHVPQFHQLPIEWRFYGMEVTWTIMRVILLGFCGLTFIVSWKTARIQVIAVVLLGLLGLGGFTAAERYFLAPIYPTLEDNLRPNGIFRQTSASSCAPAALATVLRLWEMDATESEVARLAGTSRLGTSMAQLIVAARELGMDGLELSPTWEQMRRINRPGVLATWLYSANGRVAHAVALTGMTESVAQIADPAFGRFFYVERSQFERVWRNQYVPIFRPEEKLLARSEAVTYLWELNYLPASENVADAELEAAIRRFQRFMGVTETGELDPMTVLLLRGRFLEGVPTLQ